MTTYVQVMVPEERLPAVYRLLADAAPGRGAVGGAPPASGSWTDEAFIVEHLAPRSKTIRDLAKYLAERPGQAVGSEDAAAALGLPFGWNSLAGALGAAGNYFANQGIDFPWSSAEDPDDGRARLTMSPEVAAAIRKVF